MSLFFLLSLVALAVMLGYARVADDRRQREIERTFDRLLSGNGQDALDTMTLALQEHRAGLQACGAALRERDGARMRMACEAVEGFAPGLQDGLRATRNLLRAVSVLVPLPPVAPSAWRAWELRGLAGLVAVAHNLAVTGVERVRLRLWLLGRALVWSLGRLRGGTRRVQVEPAAWTTIEVAVADLGTVGDEAEVTYERVVRALDADGKFAQPALAR
jgi:hypothetical protein